MPGKSTNDKVINLPNIIYRPCVLHVLVSPQKSLTKLGYDHSSTCYSRKASKKTWIDFMLSKRFLKKKLGEEIFFMEQDKERGCPEFFHWSLLLKIQSCGDPSWRPERNTNWWGSNWRLKDVDEQHRFVSLIKRPFLVNSPSYTWFFYVSNILARQNRKGKRYIRTCNDSMYGLSIHQ